VVKCKCDKKGNPMGIVNAYPILVTCKVQFPDGTLKEYAATSYHRKMKREGNMFYASNHGSHKTL
jgi:hypothetical protein